ncbi:hypothetical protein C5167_017957 [Papaver somniferum]|uniref:ADF-H domain-containing protein n=1 Tax=Papaver somniferum TaxID=3469 RepID=A0A4Y7IP80_PAPSO|nr:hypothetical protein C5167_017957 [Papaver somniferum]
MGEEVGILYSEKRTFRFVVYKIEDKDKQKKIILEKLGESAESYENCQKRKESFKRELDEIQVELQATDPTEMDLDLVMKMPQYNECPANLVRQLLQTGGGLGGGNGGGIATKVVCLTEVVTADELKDDEEYEDILEDMRVEGGKFGTLMNIVIPRPQPNGEPSLGLGKAFVENYDTSCLSQCLYGIIYHYVSVQQKRC